ncbi:TonB-dependent receptor [Microbulbifer harenosus]|uniref:TonB-dependent receptor n=1 Tax=Microbulbifer harenosus TaxID=2576840 RepID=A0ABY2UI98_9GAMM|nr:TonB-dependent receptor [Microbulbifer harenosus]TLM77342.1 TonB-dependent receptor [Microbulbifer harenosus]
MKSCEKKHSNLGLRPIARAILHSFGIVAIAAPTVVFAQSDAPVLEEVQVTAQKRTESMQDVPVSVSAITGDDLANTGFRDVSDIAAQVPSLIVTTNISPINASFRTRRIGNEGNIPTFEPDTALIIDGAFRSRSGLGLGDLVGVQSVEVLKGPQSTLYGKNAGAGVVSVTTAAPHDQFEAMAEVNLGTDGYRQFRGDVNSPLTDNLSGRISLTDTQRDPLIDNIVAGDGDDLDGRALRGQLLYDFSEKLSARLIVGAAQRNMRPMIADVYFSPIQQAIIAQAGHTISNNDPSDRIVESDDHSDFDQTSVDSVLTLEYQGDGYTLTSISGFEDYSADLRFGGAEEMPLHLVEFNDLQEGNSFSQELRLSSDTDGNWDWMVGAFYYVNELTRGDRNRAEFVLEEDIEEYGGVVANAALGVPLPLFGVEGDRGDFLALQDSSSFGLFSQVGTHLTEDLKLDVGLRYSWEEKTGSIVQSNQTAAGACVGKNLVCSLTPAGLDFEDSDSWSAVTGNVNLSYFLSENTMLYGLYSQGFKAGGFSLQYGVAPQESRPFGQEDITNLEAGLKTEFWGRRARLNTAVFHTEYDDFQNASFVSLGFTVNNAERVVVDGIEIDSEWLLSERLTGLLSLAYIDAVYDQYTGGQCYHGRTPDNALGQCDLSGNNLPFAPKLTGNIGLQWEQPMFTGDLYARVDYRYTGAANYSSELDPRHEQSAYAVGNFRLGWRDASYDISAWVQNLADETYYTQKLPANVSSNVDVAVGSAEGSYQTFTGTPRTAGITFRMNF